MFDAVKPLRSASVTRYAASLIALAIATPVISQDAYALQAGYLPIYEQRVGGVYTQSWYGAYLGSMDYADETDVYIMGSGKLGDFYGVLSVNCGDPSSSSWKNTGGILSTEDVPAETISNIRVIACGP